MNSMTDLNKNPHYGPFLYIRYKKGPLYYNVHCSNVIFCFAKLIFFSFCIFICYLIKVKITVINNLCLARN